MYIYNIIADTDLGSNEKTWRQGRGELPRRCARVTHDALFFYGHRSHDRKPILFPLCRRERRFSQRAPVCQGAKRPLPPRIPFLSAHVRPVGSDDTLITRRKSSRSRRASASKRPRVSRDSVLLAAAKHLGTCRFSSTSRNTYDISLPGDAVRRH